MAELGYKLSMNYKEDSSGAYISTDVTREYGLDWDEGEYKKEIVSQNLKKDLPVLITAYTGQKKKGFLFWKKRYFTDGHAWIIDAISEKTKTYESNCLWEIVYLLRNYEIEQKKGGPLLIRPADEGEIQTVADLQRIYAEVIPASEAEKKGIYHGLRTVETSKIKTSSYLMNWGWDGSYNYTEYAPSAYIWSAGGHDYQYNKKIYYNIRKAN